MYNAIMKPIEFMGATLDDIKSFPMDARREAGFNLELVQGGLVPADIKPMKTVGAGAYEIRIHVQGEWRVIYVAKFKSAVYVLHAFQKKTQKTAQSDIELAKARYKQIEDK